jgi:hypothetical protein
MDVRNAQHMLGVVVAQLDLNDLSVGQTVEIVTDKGTIWVMRTDLSVFHGYDQHESGHSAESVAVWGAGFPSRAPMITRSTRMLEKGGTFSAINEWNDQAVDTTIEHIMLLVEPPRM